MARELEANGEELLGWRWREFLATLSIGLGIQVVAVGPSGRVLAHWNADPGLCLLLGTAEGKDAVAGVWQQAAAMATTATRVLDIRPGLSAAAVTVEGVQGGLLVFGRNGVVPREELVEKAETVRRVLGTLYAVDAEARELGAKALRLAAIDEVNRLIVSLFDLETFAVERVLGVVANALVILCDAEIGWVAARHPEGNKPFLIARGFQAEDMQRSWDALDPATISITLSSNDPVTACRKLFRLPYTAAFAGKRAFHVVRLVAHGRVLGLAGIAGVRNLEAARQVLASLAPQAVIALEVGGLYAALRRQADMVLNAIHHGVVIIDRTGKISMQNRFALRYLPARVAWPQAEQAIAEVLRDGKPKPRRRQLVSFGEEEFIFAWEVVPLSDESGEVAGAVFFVEDETQLHHVKQQLKQAERLAIAGRMAAGMAHEIRNPLAAALGSLQLAKMITEPDEKDKFLDRLAGELKRLNKLLNDFLDTARPAEPERRLADIGAVMRESAFFIESEGALAGVHVTIEAPQDLPEVWIDPGQIKQVFLNLAQNALEAMLGQRGGILRITAEEVADEKLGRCLAVAFADTGSGMSEDELKQLFRPFFTTKRFGSGLGLATAQTMIHNHGGTISVRSVVGEGSVFTVTLPIKSGEGGEA